MKFYLRVKIWHIYTTKFIQDTFIKITSILRQYNFQDHLWKTQNQQLLHSWLLFVHHPWMPHFYHPQHWIQHAHNECIGDTLWNLGVPSHFHIFHWIFWPFNLLCHYFHAPYGGSGLICRNGGKFEYLDKHPTWGHSK